VYKRQAIINQLKLPEKSELNEILDRILNRGDGKSL